MFARVVERKNRQHALMQVRQKANGNFARLGLHQRSFISRTMPGWTPCAYAPEEPEEKSDRQYADQHDFLIPLEIGE